MLRCSDESSNTFITFEYFNKFCPQSHPKTLRSYSEGIEHQCEWGTVGLDTTFLCDVQTRERDASVLEWCSLMRVTGNITVFVVCTLMTHHQCALDGEKCHHKNII